MPTEKAVGAGMSKGGPQRLDRFWDRAIPGTNATA